MNTFAYGMNEWTILTSSAELIASNEYMKLRKSLKSR